MAFSKPYGNLDSLPELLRKPEMNLTSSTCTWGRRLIYFSKPGSLPVEEILESETSLMLTETFGAPCSSSNGSYDQSWRSISRTQQETTVERPDTYVHSCTERVILGL
ncbi:hypothetical protein Y032_0009g597 [Ancylostoma ceylanicum]|uniref:Uncharacterized protein n=1 Tax=Ancylostoma ceylanicum TaxID=53326 RepID=A0A016VKE2_9BILA|nr:hypothetical protein Y032_0009g597 [Ancylostoma ceylanicum]